MPNEKLFPRGSMEYHIAYTMETCEGYGTVVSVAERHKTLKTSNHQDTQIFVLRLGSSALSERTRAVIKEIYQSSKTVVDESVNKSSITDATPGAMRSWHQNEFGFLPKIAFEPEALRDKPKLYHDYVMENKRLQNKQAKKDVGGTYTGYIEFTPCSTVDNQWARIAYDYVNDKVYFTPSHYKPFQIGIDTDGFFPKVTKVVVGDGGHFSTAERWFNPFFFVPET
jgi:hypothetical protein